MSSSLGFLDRYWYLFSLRVTSAKQIRYMYRLLATKNIIWHNTMWDYCLNCHLAIDAIFYIVFCVVSFLCSSSDYLDCHLTHTIVIWKLKGLPEIYYQAIDFGGHAVIYSWSIRVDVASSAGVSHTPFSNVNSSIRFHCVFWASEQYNFKFLAKVKYIGLL